MDINIVNKDQIEPEKMYYMVRTEDGNFRAVEVKERTEFHTGPEGWGYRWSNGAIKAPNLATPEEVFEKAELRRASNLSGKLQRLAAEVADASNTLLDKSEEFMNTKMELEKVARDQDISFTPCDEEEFIDAMQALWGLPVERDLLETKFRIAERFTQSDRIVRNIGVKLGHAYTYLARVAEIDGENN